MRRWSFVQDYHFALAPQLVRERLPNSRIITFWHIPFPHWQMFEVCPWGQYLLEGLLGSSIIGFQTPLDCRNFIETVERCLGAHVDRYQDALTYGGRQVLVRAYPTSVRWPSWLGVMLADGRHLPREHPAAALPACRHRSSASASIASITPRASKRSFSRSSGCSSATRNFASASCSRSSRRRAARRCRRIASCARVCSRRATASTRASAVPTDSRSSCSRITTPRRT